jgi:molybdenum cofactor synthesis domain-containing protein
MCNAKYHDERLCRIRVEDAVGMHLAHDITEIRPGEFKGPSFHRGQKIERQDLCRLMRLGKRHLYVLDLKAGQVHEDDAVVELATALTGPGVTFAAQPREGKLQLLAAYSGLLKINTDALVAFNLIPDVMCASRHTNVPVNKGQVVAGTRAIPLVVDRVNLDRAVALAEKHAPIFKIKAYSRRRARLIITGNEIYDGLIEDKFEAIVRHKLNAYGATLEACTILPDDVEKIADATRRYLDAGTDLIITTGGMSVDPDDVTRIGIRQAGVHTLHYGTAVLPGAMGMLAYKGTTPIVGIPACGLYHKTTVFDLLLPRLLAGENPDNTDMARLCVGGLCLDCACCSFPDCSFGKAY